MPAGLDSDPLPTLPQDEGYSYMKPLALVEASWPPASLLTWPRASTRIPADVPSPTTYTPPQNFVDRLGPLCTPWALLGQWWGQPATHTAQ